MVLTLTQGALGLASGSLVGFSLGLVGGGGSILAVPLLVYLVGVSKTRVYQKRFKSRFAEQGESTEVFACPLSRDRG
jgi:hypothetical protein